ncbi:MAG: LamG domain-containing protein, partial [Armatimonadetes bacterium]|nr:LamG domain-containing protein [Armatimonadota bacterium]
IQNLVRKEGEYMLRVNPPNEGSNFSFFVNLSGWEPRVQIKRPVQAGVWYRVIARWDGSALTLHVNGEKSRLVRGGLPHVTDNPVTIGGPDLRIDELRLENPRLPVVQVRELSQEHT